MSGVKYHIKSRFLIIYASQTGQAKAISEEIAERALQYNLKPDLFCISLTDKKFSIEKENCVVFVVSTTGNGEPPDSAIKFFRRLNRNTLKSNYLENLNYTLLALGDSNYLKFAAFGRQLEHRLKALSAKSFYPSGYGDDALGIETGVDPWLDNLWLALHKQLDLEFQKNQSIELYNLKNNIDYKFLKMDASLELINSEESISLKQLHSVLKTADFENFHIPKLPSPVFNIIFDKACDSQGIHNPNESMLVLPDSPLVGVSLIAARQLTSHSEVKHTLELTFKFKDEIIKYEPGDSFGFLCCNNTEEVDLLLNRLGLQDVADLPANLILHKECSAKRKLPAHIPTLFSLREAFLHCVEIRAVPKKILLRIFAEYAQNEEEKQCLLFLSSQEGSSYFTDLIRKPSLSILDILLCYTSCKPPVEKIIEYLPSLKPRFYSASSSPLVDVSTFRIVFNVLKIKKGEGRQMDRKGVCTGWLHDLSSQMLVAASSDITDKLSVLKLEENPKSLFVYKRKNQHFKFPDDLKKPVIMVGPGTGIAPFIGYLQHCEKLIQKLPDNSHIAEIWLFYGCRHKDKDFLYKTELDRQVQSKVLQNLVVSFSRDTPTSDLTPKYVHENIKLHAQEISKCIESGARIFVCGDAKHMVHDVQASFIQALQIASGIDQSKAKCIIENLQKEHRYVNDVWA